MYVRVLFMLILSGGQLISLLRQLSNVRFAVSPGSLETRRMKLRAQLSPPSRTIKIPRTSDCRGRSISKATPETTKRRPSQAIGRDGRTAGRTANATLSRKSDPSLFQPHFELSFNWTRTSQTQSKAEPPALSPANRGLSGVRLNTKVTKLLEFQPYLSWLLHP